MNKFNSQVCTTIEQSQRLLEMGLKPETADCMHSYLIKDFKGREVAESDRHYYLSLFNQDEFQAVGLSQYEKIPAWSLHRLIEMIPSEIKPRNCYYSLTFDKDIVQYEYYEYGIEVLKSFGDSLTLYDNIIDCVVWLIKENLFNKEYLK